MWRVGGRGFCRPCKCKCLFVKAKYYFSVSHRRRITSINKQTANMCLCRELETDWHMCLLFLNRRHEMIPRLVQSVSLWPQHRRRGKFHNLLRSCILYTSNSILCKETIVFVTSFTVMWNSIAFVWQQASQNKNRLQHLAQMEMYLNEFIHELAN